MPVSLTENLICPLLSFIDIRDAFNSISPFSVNFSALLKRFASIWRTLTGSTIINLGILESILMSSSMPFLLAEYFIKSAACSIKSMISVQIISSSNLPASIFEKSSISFIMPRSPLPLVRIVSAYCFWILFRSVSSNNSEKPITLFIGVRISWDILARNSDLVLLATSACSFAWMISSSACFCLVISWIIPLTLYPVSLSSLINFAIECT